MRLSLTVLLLLLAPATLSAQEWQLRTRIVMTGSSKESEPAGWQVYSAISLEAAVRRTFASELALELALRTESREVDFDAGGAEPEPRGAAELLPITLTMLYAPRREHAFRPYIGAGVTTTIAWEKSGALNSSDLTPEIGPAVQLGVDRRLSDRAAFNADLRWNALRPDLKLNSERVAALQWDALVMGLGVALKL